MSNRVEALAEYLSVADVQLEMSSSGTSRTIISTDHLGPCVGFLLDFRRGNQELCFLNHYSLDDDESGLRLAHILVLMLNHICDDFKKKRSKKVSAKFEVYKFLVFSKILGHNFNAPILNYTNRDF